MMPKKYPKSLKSTCKKFAQKNNIFDIVLYGSAVKGKEKPKDLDLLLIFESMDLKQRTNMSQDLKEKLKKKTKQNLDIKTINLKELFQKEFLARQGLLSEGYSLLKNKYFSKRFGFKGNALFSYNLKNLNHNNKTKFTYALSGRNKKGMLEKVKGTRVGKGAVLVPIEKSLVFENFLEKWQVDYNKKILLVSLI